MIIKIETVDDVKAFAKQLIAEEVSFHPDDDFNNYVNFKKNISTYTREEADFRNGLMNQCFEVCEKDGFDIYAVMLEVSLIETGLDKFIPLPSKLYLETN